jgi:hypothetical protein
MLIDPDAFETCFAALGAVVCRGLRSGGRGDRRHAAAVAFEFAAEPQAPQAETMMGIRATTIDSLGLDDISFIRIDCQGADYHVLLDAEETIRSSRPVTVFESEHYLKQGQPIVREDYENLMFQLGYTTTAISNKGDGRRIDFPAVPAS